MNVGGLVCLDIYCLSWIMKQKYFNVDTYAKQTLRALVAGSHLKQRELAYVSLVVVVFMVVMAKCFANIEATM